MVFLRKIEMFHGEDIEAPHKYKIGELDDFYKGDPLRFVRTTLITQRMLGMFKKKKKLGQE